MREKQQPLGTGFNPATTAAQVAEGVDFAGKIVILTGGGSHLGLETARVLTWIGATVIVPTRDVAKAQAALAGLANVEVYQMELTDPTSIDRFAALFLRSGRAVDRLILNAGIMAAPLFRDGDGNEGQLSTNHLGHFRLTGRLWPALKAARGARIVTLSSRAHHLSDVDLTDLNFVARDYDRWLAYGQSKTANVLFAVSADARGREHDIRAFALHPGLIYGPLAKFMSTEELVAFGAIEQDGTTVIDPQNDKKTLPQGAATTVWCATSPLLNDLGGVYCENCDISPVVSEGDFGVRPYAVNPMTAERLWQESERLTGVTLVP
ncbi:SDR family NAD(P)-dependent oxidoreductase [Rhizobium sp. WYJ-E13]|uniref:SDR family NAD(P)-dependent oxidoreductase n=1 Tax=Rhizobium sp. WYJ-E13 TaxID=2849093 RepID=UPI001C1ED0A9|nr:SDR family NAD(P)-dependent oxidoreductase [Rhizobium sp. WYJ-E13]QWW72298.1 SDR family NAD(P)-dependent oxidoreductase [Rhizobium sp. WYJ-E13]